jgi:hypothetical protein
VPVETASLVVDPALPATVVMGGGTTVVIPAGTFSETVTINVYAYATGSAPAASTAFGVLFMNTTYIIDAGGLEPAAGSSVTITLPYNPADIPNGYTASELTMAYYDGTNWVNVPSTVDTVNRTVTTVVDHFSWWAVVLRVHTPTPTTTPEYPEGNRVVIYPNPSSGSSSPSGQAHISFPDLINESDVKVQVLTTSFREVYEQTFVKVRPGVPLTIPATDQWNKPLANGLYYVAVTTPHGRYLGKWLILR